MTDTSMNRKDAEAIEREWAESHPDNDLNGGYPADCVEED